MSNDEIRELIQLVVESGIAELELERGGDRVRIRRTLEPRAAFATQAPPGASAAGKCCRDRCRLAVAAAAGARRE